MAVASFYASLSLAIGVAALASLVPAASWAAEPASGGVSATGGAETEGPSGDAVSGPAEDGMTDQERAVYLEKREMESRPWVKRWPPRRNTVELGLFGGVFLPAQDHDLYNPRSAPQQPLWAAAPEIGVRVGYFPLSFLGVEAEFSAIPARLRNANNDFAFVYGARGHLMARVPVWRLSPFVVFGGGMLAINSHEILQGKDADPAMHYGVGLQYFATKRLVLRVEMRHIFSAQAATQTDVTSHFSVLGGVGLALGKKPKPVPPPDLDRDKDGFKNDIDACPDTPGIEPDGCPPKDTDEDGFYDRDDECPDVPGVEPDGCPPPDTDGDGFVDPEDKCPNEPENFNGYEDDDGCPDVLDVFDGVIEGIFFDFGKATIKSESSEVLDEAISTLDTYPDVRLEISGHTDDVGSDDANQKLSEERAEAVKKYLVDGGVDPERLTTRGAGRSEPIDESGTKEARAKNRRIEFKVLEGKGSVAKHQKDKVAPKADAGGESGEGQQGGN